MYLFNANSNLLYKARKYKARKSLNIYNMKKQLKPASGLEVVKLLELVAKGKESMEVSHLCMEGDIDPK